MEGLAKSDRSEDLGADRVLGHEGSLTDVGDEGNSHGWLFPDASHRERSELGEISTIGWLGCPYIYLNKETGEDSERKNLINKYSGGLILILFILPSLTFL
jgi:hypothetical protein